MNADCQWEDAVHTALRLWLQTEFRPCRCQSKCSQHIEFLWRKRFKDDLVTQFVRAKPWFAKADRLKLRDMMVMSLQALGYPTLLANTSSCKARVNFPDGTSHRVTGIALSIQHRDGVGGSGAHERVGTHPHREGGTVRNRCAWRDVDAAPALHEPLPELPEDLLEGLPLPTASDFGHGSAEAPLIAYRVPESQRVIPWLQGKEQGVEASGDPRPAPADEAADPTSIILQSRQHRASEQPRACDDDGSEEEAELAEFWSAVERERRERVSDTRALSERVQTERSCELTEAPDARAGHKAGHGEDDDLLALDGIMAEGGDEEGETLFGIDPDGALAAANAARPRGMMPRLGNVMAAAVVVPTDATRKRGPVTLEGRRAKMIKSRREIEEESNPSPDHVNPITWRTSVILEPGGLYHGREPAAERPRR